MGKCFIFNRPFFQDNNSSSTPTSPIIQGAITISTTAQDGVEYDRGLAGLCPEDVSAIAQAISNVSDESFYHDVYVDSENVHRKLCVGEQVKISIDGEEYAFDIIGFNHDILTDPMAYGAETATGKAGLTLQMHNVFDTAYTAELEGVSTGYKESYLRNTVLENIFNNFPENWKTVVKNVDKNVGIYEDSTGGVETISDKLFLLSPMENSLSKKYTISYEDGSMYVFYQHGHPSVRTERNCGYAVKQVLRSPAISNSTYYPFTSVAGDRYPVIDGIGYTPKDRVAVNEDFISPAFCI